MLEIVISGGWVMVPIILCSIVAAAIILERLWTLQPQRVVPRNLSRQVWEWISTNQLNHQRIEELRRGSPLGQILAAGLSSRQQDRTSLKEVVEDTGRHVVHELERYLNTLGTIAAISPLLGLLGTVTGMIRTFSALTANTAGDPSALAGGISEALITTAAGLMVAIPALIGYRYLRGRVDALVVQMEKDAIGLVEMLEFCCQEAGRGANQLPWSGIRVALKQIKQHLNSENGSPGTPELEAPPARTAPILRPAPQTAPSDRSEEQILASEHDQTYRPLPPVENRSPAIERSLPGAENLAMSSLASRIQMAPPPRGSRRGYTREIGAEGSQSANVTEKVSAE